jgi:hypothetical protein
VTFLGWTVSRGEDRELTLRLPTLTAWRAPRYVLWGARGWDVQIGSAQDLARQRVLNRRAAAARAQLVMVLRFRDAMTPVMRDLDAQFKALAAAMRPAAEAARAMAEAQEAGRRAALRSIAESVR